MRGSNFGLDWENCGHFLEEFGNVTGCLHAEARRYIEILFV